MDADKRRLLTDKERVYAKWSRNRVPLTCSEVMELLSTIAQLRAENAQLAQQHSDRKTVVDDD
jgi:hypothetical protein